jgi:hypothetical protein
MFLEPSSARIDGRSLRTTRLRERVLQDLNAKANERKEVADAETN